MNSWSRIFINISFDSSVKGAGYIEPMELHSVMLRDEEAK